MNLVALFFALVCFVWVFHLGSCQPGGGGGGGTDSGSFTLVEDSSANFIGSDMGGYVIHLSILSFPCD